MFSALTIDSNRGLSLYAANRRSGGTDAVRFIEYGTPSATASSLAFADGNGLFVDRHRPAPGRPALIQSRVTAARR